MTGWMYAPESKDTVANLLVSIDTVAHGSAGGSLHQANALLDGSEDPAILDDAGDAGFDLKEVSSDRVDGLNKTVTKLLRDAGVTDEWKNHTDARLRPQEPGLLPDPRYPPPRRIAAKANHSAKTIIRI